MSVKEKGRYTLPKSVRLTREEGDLLRQVSQAELISEAALMRKFVLEGLRRYRLDQAIKRYHDGELDLSSAAQIADLSIRELMWELTRRGGDIYGPESRVLEGLGALAEAFGASDALQRRVRPA